MTPYTYLLIDFFSLIVPLLFSFHPKILFYKQWRAILAAIVITGIFYTLWDSWFTHLGVWGFTPRYLTGLHLGNLPVEEILFFVCIPYSCVFTFECLSRITSPAYSYSTIKFINYSFVGILLILSFVFYNKPYTVTAFSILALMILIATFRNIQWLPKFYIIYGVLLVPFLIVNGLLTGTCLSKPVVWYNPDGIIGLRILTIPVEDIFYGMGLVLANVWIYLSIKSRNETAN